MATIGFRSLMPGRFRFLGTLMLGAYVLINLTLYALNALTPVVADWPIWGVTALAVPPMVLGMVYLVMPVARRSLPA